MISCPGSLLANSLTSLQSRLARLREQSGSQGGISGSSSLAERLSRLRPQVTRAEAKKIDEPALAAMLGAERLVPGLLGLRWECDAEQCHGRFVPGQAARHIDALSAAASGPPETWCFVDTETSGLSGGTGTWVFLFGAAWLRGDRLMVEQFLLTRLDAEPMLLERIGTALAEATLLVTYNGKSFDVPLLGTRCRLAAGTDPPEVRSLAARIESLDHLDLLHPVRRAFARRWPDCRLGTVEARLLDFHRAADLPGSEAPAVWLDWLRRGDAARLPDVIEHNRNDLLSLTALIPALASVYREPLAYGADCHGVAQHWQRRGQHARARALLESSIQDAGGGSDAIWLLAWLYRRERDWPRACGLWERLAAEGHQGALEALAKFHEHLGRNPKRALDYAARLPPGPAREHRCRRLRGKIQTEASFDTQAGLPLT